jgi:hypothetical protein
MMMMDDDWGATELQLWSSPRLSAAAHLTQQFFLFSNNSRMSSNNATVTALKLFDGWTGKTELVTTYVEASKGDFTAAELDEYTKTFIKFDVNKSGDLDEFELNKMFEARNEHKTHMELVTLIQSISKDFGSSIKNDGVTFAAFLSIMLKDKKGQTKTEW